MIKHLPNLVTAFRGACGPIVSCLLLADHGRSTGAGTTGGLDLVPFWVFVLAIATDLVDGWLARWLDARSATGLWLDPLADKLLTDTVWAALWAVGYAPGWLCGAVIARDAGVILAWAWALPRGMVWTPNAVGQVSVAFEGVAVSVLLFHGPWLDVHWPSVGVVLGTTALALSLGSVAQYIHAGPRGASGSRHPDRREPS